MKCQSLQKHTTRREKGHSQFAHRNTLTHTAVMDGNNIFIGASGRQSFHPCVQTPIETKGKAKTWLMRWNVQESPENPSFKNHSHVRGGGLNDQYKPRTLSKVCVCVVTPPSVELPVTFPPRKSSVDGKMSPIDKEYVHVFKEVLSLSILSALLIQKVVVWLKFNGFLHVPPQLHDTAGQMGCQCCRMIKR